MVKPKRVGHLVLNVRDVEASTKFYTEVLGFEIAIERPMGTFLTCGQIHHDLALFKAPEDAAPVAEGQLGMNHFAVQIGDMDELKELYQGLKSHGARIDHTVDHGMTASVYFFDPDGNKIEFYYDKCETEEEGLAMMRDTSRKNAELILEEAPVS
jgi:catechol 2,3-dioxygenase